MRKIFSPIKKAGRLTVFVCLHTRFFRSYQALTLTTLIGIVEMTFALRKTFRE